MRRGRELNEDNHPFCLQFRVLSIFYLSPSTHWALSESFSSPHSTALLYAHYAKWRRFRRFINPIQPTSDLIHHLTLVCFHSHTNKTKHREVIQVCGLGAIPYYCDPILPPTRPHHASMNLWRVLVRQGRPYFAFS